MAFDTGDQVGDHRAGEHPLDDHALEVLGTADARGTEFFEGCHLLWTLDGHTVLPMDRAADNLIDVTWVGWAAGRLREQWPRVDAATLQDTARELWRDETLRAIGPRQAVEKRLRRGIPDRTEVEVARRPGQGQAPTPSPPEMR